MITDAPQHELPGPEAREWIADQLGKIGSTPSDRPDEPRVRPWSVVVRIPTDKDVVWFKANRGLTAYEPALLSELGRYVPDLVLAPIATDVERGWSLLPDGGPILRSLPDDAVLGHWERILPAYADLQQVLTHRTAELIAMGIPDDRPEMMPRQLAALLEQTDVLLLNERGGLSADEHSRLRQSNAEFTAKCDVLAGSGIEPSVDHSDLHDGNVFVRDGGYAVFDWGDACITHPFATLLVTMSMLQARYDLPADAPALARLRDAYLEPWTTSHSRRELVELAAIATAVAPLTRARSWERALCEVPPAERGEYRDAVPGWLRELLME